MKKNVLALSIAAMVGGFAGAASAQTFPNTGMVAPTGTTLELNDKGAGNILIVPYATSADSNVSVMHVVNTDTVHGKAVKVRYRGAANSDDILDFTVFLSPGDVWTGYTATDADGPYFQTDDKSCAYPVEAFRDSANKPIKVRFSGARLAEGAKVNNLQESYVEILNMADINKTVGGVTSEMWKSTKHVNGVAPCDPATLDKILNINPTDSASVQAAADLGFDTPSGGLTGDWYILNVDKTTTFSGSATAVRVAGADTRGNFVLFPQAASNVAVNAGNVAALTADPLLAIANPGMALDFDAPDLSTPYLPALATPSDQANSLTSQLSSKGVMNQFALDKSISALTDWTLSMPTRRYSVAYDYTKTGDAGRVFNPLVTTFTAGNTTVRKNADGENLICVTTGSNTFWDREEFEKTNNGSVSPIPVATKIPFCGEVAVLKFADQSVLGASVTASKVSLPGEFENGWGTINYGTDLPLLGSSFIKLFNAGGLANGFSGSYGIT